MKSKISKLVIFIDLLLFASVGPGCDGDDEGSGYMPLNTCIGFRVIGNGTGIGDDVKRCCDVGTKVWELYKNVKKGLTQDQLTACGLDQGGHSSIDNSGSGFSARASGAMGSARNLKSGSQSVNAELASGDGGLANDNQQASKAESTEQITIRTNKNNATGMPSTGAAPQSTGGNGGGFAQALSEFPNLLGNLFSTDSTDQKAKNTNAALSSDSDSAYSGGGSPESTRSRSGNSSGSAVQSGNGSVTAVNIGAGIGGSVAPLVGEDPADYFTRIGLGDDIFKQVHKRYLTKEAGWFTLTK